MTSITLAIFGHVYACKCDDPGTVKESYIRSSLIVHGKVISRKAISYANTIRADKVEEIRKSVRPDMRNLFNSEIILEVKFQVLDHLKGSVRDTLTIFTPIGGGSCGYRFELQKD